MNTSESMDADATTSDLKPTYKVPEEFFKLKGKGECRGNWVYVCQKCQATVSASYNSRANLKRHIRAKHTRSVAGFEAACPDGRKKDAPAAEKGKSCGLIDFFVS